MFRICVPSDNVLKFEELLCFHNIHDVVQKRRWDFGTFLPVDSVSVHSLFACSVSGFMFVCVLCRFYLVSTLVPRLCFCDVLAFFV